MLCISHSSLLSGNDCNWNISLKQIAMKKKITSIYLKVFLWLYCIGVHYSLLTYPPIFSLISHFGFNERNCYIQDLSGIYGLLTLKTLYTTCGKGYELIILWMKLWTSHRFLLRQDWQNFDPDPNDRRLSLI